MLRTRWLNEWLGTHFTPEEVEARDLLEFEMAMALQRGMNPPKVE